MSSHALGRTICKEKSTTEPVQCIVTVVIVVILVIVVIVVILVIVVIVVLWSRWNQHLTHWLNERQGHLLSCPGQLKILLQSFWWYVGTFALSLPWNISQYFRAGQHFLFRGGRGMGQGSYKIFPGLLFFPEPRLDGACIPEWNHQFEKNSLFFYLAYSQFPRCFPPTYNYM